MINTSRLLFTALLITISVSVTTFGYTPGPVIIRECPQCKAELGQITTRSGNTFGARFWTDGKMIARMLPDRLWLVTCPKCETVLWIEDANQLGVVSFLDTHKKWPNVVEPVQPKEEDYLATLDTPNLPIIRETYLRRRAWWAANDVTRTNENTELILSPAQEANLTSLIQLMDQDDPDQRLTKAELYRQLKQFDECISVLTYTFNNERHAQVAAFIKGLAEKGIWKVMEIQFQKRPNNRLNPISGSSIKLPEKD